MLPRNATGKPNFPQALRSDLIGRPTFAQKGGARVFVRREGSIMADEASFALLTKSYASDHAMCRALCESIDAHMPGVRHYLVVDRRDLSLFAPLAREGRTILETEGFLPGLASVQALGRRWWLSLAAPPIRGWIQQQMAKIAVAASLAEDAVVLVDSDVVFFRGIDPGRLARDGRVRLYRAPGSARDGEHLRWHEAAADLLGLPRRGYFGADYITNAVTWRPDVVRAMIARIEQTTRLPWRVALSRRLRFSEYILYGVFAEHVPGTHAERLFPDTGDLCHCSWHYDLTCPAGVTRFVENFDDGHVAVLIQSNLALSPQTRNEILLGIADRLGRGAASA